jgi:hypothetical protein
VERWPCGAKRVAGRPKRREGEMCCGAERCGARIGLEEGGGDGIEEEEGGGGLRRLGFGGSSCFYMSSDQLGQSD